MSKEFWFVFSFLGILVAGAYGFAIAFRNMEARLSQQEFNTVTQGVRLYAEAK